MVEIKTTLFDAKVEVKESLALIKKRLFDNQPFIMLTTIAGAKVIYNKSVIGEVLFSLVIEDSLKVKGKKKKK